MGWLREQLQCQFCPQLPQEATGSHQAAENQGLAQAPPASHCDICKTRCAGAQVSHPCLMPPLPCPLWPARGQGWSLPKRGLFLNLQRQVCIRSALRLPYWCLSGRNESSTALTVGHRNLILNSTVRGASLNFG